MSKWQNEMDFERGGVWGVSPPWSKPQFGVEVRETESISLRKQAASGAALVSKKKSSKISPSSQNIGKQRGRGGGRLNLCDVSTKLPSVALGRAAKGRAWLFSEKCCPCLRLASLQPGPLS